MGAPSAKEKDFVLSLYYDRDIKGVPPPDEEKCPTNLREIETILQDDGYIEPYKGYLIINVKGRAFMNKGGYTAIRNKELIKYGIGLVSGAFSVIVAWLLSQCSK